METEDPKFELFNKYLNSLPMEIIQRKSEEQQIQDEKDFQELKETLKQGKCKYCGNPLSHFSEREPCFHWLFWKANGLRKKHLISLFEQKSYHQIDAYLRWVANSDVPIKNINDLVEERSSSKIIETTIKYKNLEWSFSCSKGDMEGHEGRHEGEKPHYHFQMKIDGNVIIKYGDFHAPFTDFDEFSFAVKNNKFDRLKATQTLGAGMQAMFDMFSPEELVDIMRSTDDEDAATFDVGTMVIADKGTTISGEDLFNLIEESKRTGESLAKLSQKLKNATVQTIISPGPGVPDMAPRTPRNRGKGGPKGAQ